MPASTPIAAARNPAILRCRDPVAVRVTRWPVPQGLEHRAGDFFGASVSLSGDALTVGAYSKSSAATGVNGNQADNTASSSGAVYVFR